MDKNITTTYIFHIKELEEFFDLLLNKVESVCFNTRFVEDEKSKKNLKDRLPSFDFDLDVYTKYFIANLAVDIRGELDKSKTNNEIFELFEEYVKNSLEMKNEK